MRAATWAGLRQAMARLGVGGGRHIDQIANLVELITRDPYSRRQIVTAWNPGEIHRMALAPLPLPVPDSGRCWAPQSATLPAQRRHLIGRSVQHRELRAIDPHAGARMRAGTGHVRVDRRRLPPYSNHLEQARLQAQPRTQALCRSS
jgi:hypothetical protein